MPILFCVVSSGTTILAEHATCSGNFEETIKHLLPKIPSGNHKDTYTHSDYKFHYTLSDSITYLCIADNETAQNVAFKFLEDVKDRFQSQYNISTQRALPYSLQSDFSVVIKNQMKHHNSLLNSNTTLVNLQVDELKNIMVHSIDQLMNRGEKLELLVNKSKNLSENSMTFRKSSVMIKKKTCWKNAKMVIIIIILSLVMLYAVISGACGGLAWKGCFSKHNRNSSRHEYA